MKKSGFTLVELLAVIVILGVIASIGVASYTYYINQANDTYYVDAEETARAAAESFLTYCSSTLYGEDFCRNVVVPSAGNSISVSISTLMDKEFMKVVDSVKTGNRCSGEVVITNNGITGGNYDLSYKVCLRCDDFQSEACQ